MKIVRLAVGVALFGWVLARTDAPEALARLLGAPWALAAIVAIPFLGAAIEAIRLHLLFEAQGLDVSIPYAYRIVAIATLFNFTLPGGTGGDALKLYYLCGRHRGRVLEIGTTLLADRIIALFAFIVVTLALGLAVLTEVLDIPSIRSLYVFLAAVGAALLLGAAFLGSARLRRSALLERGRGRFFPPGSRVERVGRAVATLASNRAASVKACAISAVGHIALAAMFVVAGAVILPDAGPMTVCFLSLLGLLANALPLTPGGLGVGEAAFDRLFGLAGHAGGAALLLAWRAAIIPVGALGMWWYARGAGSGGALRPDQVPEPGTAPPLSRDLPGGAG